MSVAASIWCIGPARFVKELAALIDGHARVRWIADGAALERVLASSSECGTVVVEHSPDGASLACLERVQRQLPRARRLVVLEVCELKIVRGYLEAGAATEILYRPLDRATLLRSCGIAKLASASTPPTASLPA
jgi:hypothetical protein